MRKLALVILIITTVFSANAQKRFELDVTSKLGYYIPIKETGIPDKYFPKNAFSPAAGLSLGYNFFKSTSVLLGVEYSYLSPEISDFDGSSLDITWHSLNVPLNIQQGIGKNFFLSGGITLIRQLKGYYKENSAFPLQEIPEYNWQAGVGYKLKDLRISAQYYRGFKRIDKDIVTGESGWYCPVKHQEVFVKLEYPLWKF
jgi:hypothetical protein